MGHSSPPLRLATSKLDEGELVSQSTQDVEDLDWHQNWSPFRRHVNGMNPQLLGKPSLFVEKFVVTHCGMRECHELS